MGSLINFLTSLDLPQKTIVVWITSSQLIGRHQKGCNFGKQVIKEIALELLRTKCNANFMYSVSATSSALKLVTWKTIRQFRKHIRPINKIFTEENKILLVNNLEELTIPQISVFLFVHDIIVIKKVTPQNFVKEKFTLQNVVGVKEV